MRRGRPPGKTWAASLQGLRTFTSLSCRELGQRDLGQEEGGHLLPTLAPGVGRSRAEAAGEEGPRRTVGLGGQLGSGSSEPQGQAGGRLVESRGWCPQQASLSTRPLSSLLCSSSFSHECAC